MTSTPPDASRPRKVTPRQAAQILAERDPVLARLLAIAMYLPIAAFSHFLYVRGIEDPVQREINRRLFRLMISADCLMNENIVMRFRKMVAREAVDHHRDTRAA